MNGCTICRIERKKYFWLLRVQTTQCLARRTQQCKVSFKEFCYIRKRKIKTPASLFDYDYDIAALKEAYDEDDIEELR